MSELPRHKGKLTSVLIFISFLFPVATSKAIEPAFKYIKHDSTAVIARLEIADSLPSDLISYINKGVPILFDWRLELWRERSGWFDKLVDNAAVSLKVRFDPWEKRYSVVQDFGSLVIENELESLREALELLMSTGPDTLAMDDTSGIYYLVGRVTIQTMSFSNYREVESWLKGGVSDAKKPKLEEAPGKVGEFFFNVALRISGFKNISREIRSPNFKSDDLLLLQH